MSVDLAELPPARGQQRDAQHSEQSKSKDNLDHLSAILAKGTSRTHELAPDTQQGQSLGPTGRGQDGARAGDKAHAGAGAEKGHVGFLTRRLRSAIGQDILTDEENAFGHAFDATEDGESREGSSSSDGAVRSNATLSRKAKRPASTENVQEAVKTDSHEAESSKEPVGWGWSTFTSLPSTFKLDGALRSMSLSRSNDGDEASTTGQPDADEGLGSSTPSAGGRKTSGDNIQSYMAALDMRRWFVPGESNQKSVQGLDKPNRDSTHALKGSHASPSPSRSPSKAPSAQTSPACRLPAGSFPASSVSSRKKKERKDETAAAAAPSPLTSKPSQPAGKPPRKLAPSDNMVEHDLTAQALGLQSAEGLQSRFPDHEFLVLSTAGKPIYASNISKARLGRAQVHRERKRSKHAEAEARRRDGEDADEAARLAQADLEEEEGMAKQEQDLQDEEDQGVATRVGLVQALISNYAESGRLTLHEKSREFLELPPTGRICYLLKPPLYLVAIARWDEAESTLRSHLEYLYFAIVSLLSVSKLNRLFDRAANFDLKRLLHGTDGILDALLTRIQRDTTAMRGTLQPMRLDAALRHDAGAALMPSHNKAHRPQDALYALLLTRSGLVTVARARTHSIHPIDCQLLINTVFATKALKEGGTQSWVPICLPKFAPHGFVYAHVSFLDDEAILRRSGSADKDKDRQQEQPPSHSYVSSKAASKDRENASRPELGLVLVTGNPDGFEDMSAWRTRIVEKLCKGDLIVKVWEQTRPHRSKSVVGWREVGATDSYNGETGDEVEEEEDNDRSYASARSGASYSADELGIAGLRHFCFKWRSNVQSTSPVFETPYQEGSEGHRRLLYLYGLAHDYIARPASTHDDTAVVLAVTTTSSKDTDAERMGGADTALPSKTTESKKSDNIEQPETDKTGTDTDAGADADADAGSSARAKTTTSARPEHAPRSPSPPIVARSVLGGKPHAKAKAYASPSPSSPSSASMHVVRTTDESVLAWSTPAFELAVAASPHMSRAALLQLARAVAKWVKQEEHRLFIVSAPVF